jgi:hypothetical protein
MSVIVVGKEKTHDIKLYYKEWGNGQPIVFSHGWPLMLKIAANPDGLPIKVFDDIRDGVHKDRSQYKILKKTKGASHVKKTIK